MWLSRQASNLRRFRHFKQHPHISIAALRTAHLPLQFVQRDIAARPHERFYIELSGRIAMDVRAVANLVMLADDEAALLSGINATICTTLTLRTTL